MGNGERVADTALWTYVLNLLSDLCLNLKDCCYVLTLTRNVIFMFEQKGFYLYFMTMVVTL